MDKSDYTEWFTPKLKPTRRGVYQTSRDVVLQDGRNIKDLGNGYAFWDGYEWHSYRSWGNHLSMRAIYDAVWRGLASPEAAKKYKREHGDIE